ncbi:MAG: hypothetical protein ED559_07615 [Phycisphaera sp.]|nr:MAG: hypothetical protein ED559_07615 [Phycisphaera sp.]
MTRNRTRHFALVASFAGLAATAPLSVLAQEGGDDAVIDLRFGGLANIEPHGKDAAAYEAVMMLGERLAEIPEETDGPEEARALIELAWSWLSGSTGLQLTQTNQAPGLALALAATPHGMSGDEFTGIVTEIMRETGGPIDEDDQGTYLSTPIGRARIETVNDGSTMSITLGTEDHASTDPLMYDLPAGSTSLMSGQFHLQRFGQFIVQIISEEEPELGEFIEQYRWVIDEAPLVDFAYGNDADYQYITSRAHDGKDWLVKLGMDPDVTITGDQFADVPQDATTLYIFPFSLDFILNIVDQLAEAEGEDPFGELEDALGFDVRGDVLENLGPRFTYYQSLSTGGGGLTSAVMICELEDAERLASTHAELRNQLNDVLSEEARGYVRVRSWEAAGHEVFSLTTPGIPLPFEPSWSIAGDSLVLAASPVGIVAALEQINTDGASIADSPVFKAAMAGITPEDGVSTVTFSNTEWFAGQGYSTANFMASALANAVRSPSDPTRDAGMLMPGYHEFTSGIKPMGAVEYWEGDDYVAMMRMEGSVLVEVAEFSTQMGGIRGLAAIAALQAGAALPALQSARESAQQVKAASQVRSLVMAAVTYSIDHDGNGPDSYDVLIENGYIGWEMLSSPAGPAYDDLGDIVLRLDLDDGQLSEYNADFVIAIDRAAYVNGGMDVSVGFADGHVETLSYWEVDEILDLDENTGAREAFQLD